MPDDIDLRGLVGSDVLDQGYRPTCIAFASSAAHEALLGTPHQPSQHLAPEALWWHATRVGMTSCDGMVLGDIEFALKGPGQPDLALWPYNPTLGAGTEEPPDDLADPPWHRARLEGLPLCHDGVERALEDALQGSHPVILIVEVTDEFHTPDVDGIVAIPEVTASAGGYHAVVCVGAATHPVHGRLLLVKNSWGTDWGRGGYCWLPVEYLIAFAGEAALVMDAWEKSR